MKNVNFQWAGELHSRLARQKGEPAGAEQLKRVVRQAAEKDGSACRKGQPPGLPFSTACLNVQLTGPSCSAAFRPVLCSLPIPRKFLFLFGNTALRLV